MQAPRPRCTARDRRLVRMAERESWSLGAALRGVFASEDDRRGHLGRPRGRAHPRRLRAGRHRGDRRADPGAGRAVPHDRPDATCSGCSASSSRSGSSKYDPTLKLTERPAVVLVVGVNGVGKTTTIGKFAKLPAQLRPQRRRRRGRHVPRGRRRPARHVGRARRASGSCAPSSEGQDPASVAFQTVENAKQRRHRDRHHRHRRPPADQGRPHGRARARSGASSRSRRRSPRCCSCSTRRPARTASPRPRRSSSTPASPASCSPSSTASAKGGFVLARAGEDRLPIKLIGQGEGIGDLTGFTPHVFAQQLVG